MNEHTADEFRTLMPHLINTLQRIPNSDVTPQAAKSIADALCTAKHLLWTLEKNEAKARQAPSLRA